MRDLNSMLMFLDVRIFAILSNTVLAIPILLLISLSHFPSSVAMQPRYTILSTCWIGFPSTLILILGAGFFLLITIDFVLIMFISMPYGLPFSFTAVSKACRNIGPSASKTVSSAYLRLLIFTPPIFIPFISSTSLNIFSVYRLNKFGDSTQPCRTPFFILKSDVIPLSVLTHADCSQYSLLIICKSLSSLPISDKHSIILKCLTLSKAFV